MTERPAGRLSTIEIERFRSDGALFPITALTPSEAHAAVARPDDPVFDVQSAESASDHLAKATVHRGTVIGMDDRQPALPGMRVFLVDPGDVVHRLGDHEALSGDVEVVET